MDLRCSRAVVCLLVASLALSPFLPGSLVEARERSDPKVSLSVFQCPAGMTEADLVSVDCSPLTSAVDVELVSIEGSQPKVTLADAQADGNVFRWTLSPSDAEIDNWGIRQSALPAGSTAYVIQGSTVAFKPSPQYDFRFTTSESDPQSVLSMFIFSAASQGVIIPESEPAAQPDQEAPPQETAAANQPEAASTTEPDSPPAAATPVAPVDTGFARSEVTPEHTDTVEEDNVAMRLAADLQAVVVDTLAKGEVVGILSGPIETGADLWYEVESNARAIGWVEASAFDGAQADLDPADAPAAESPAATAGDAPESDEPVSDSALVPGDRAIVADPPLNLRADASSDAEVIQSLSEGQLLSVDALAGDDGGETWLAVTLLPERTTSGYVAAAYLEEAGLLTGDPVEVTGDAANLRSQPSTSATIVETLQPGSTGTVLDGPTSTDGLDWYLLLLPDDQSGWVAGSLLSLAEDALSEQSEPLATDGFRAGAWVTVVDPPINLRTAPSVESEAIEALEDGDLLVVLSGPESAGENSWYLVDFDGVQGYAAGEFLGGGFTPGERVSVTDGPIYIRTEPGIDADIVWNLAQDELATVVSPAPLSDGEFLWIQVESDSGYTGYVAIDFIAPQEGAPPE